MKCLILFALVLAASPLGASELEITTLAGTGTPGYSGDGGQAAEAQVNNPFGVEVGPDGNLYFCDTGNHAIRRIDRKTGIISTFAGTGGVDGYAGDGGPATGAQLFEPYELRFDRGGNLFFAEMKNHVVRRVDAETGIISTVAGTGEEGFSGDGGPASRAKLRQPHSIVIDSEGDLFICDIGNHRIRRVDAETGGISTYCGTGAKEGPAEGAEISPETPLKGPRALAIDRDGNFWLALREGNRVVKFDRGAGVIHQVAGTGEGGFTGNGGPARGATLSGPKGIVVDDQRKFVYLADTESHSVRVIDLGTAPPTLRLVAGTGSSGSGPDGDPLLCAMARPHGIGLDAKTGEVFIGDSEAHKVRVISARDRPGG
jgi:streptogramin lyase